MIKSRFFYVIAIFATLAEVSTLGDTMWKLYDGFVTMHKAIVCVHGLQQQSKEFVQTLKNIHATIAHVQEWIMQYKGALLDLVKKMKPHAELEKAKV